MAALKAQEERCILAEVVVDTGMGACVTRSCPLQ